MRRLSFILFLLVSVLWFLVSLSNAEEEKITITTYYPSPYGVYREMRAQRMAIGNDYIQGGTYCWPDETCDNRIYTDLDDDTWFDPGEDLVDLVVKGNVGIGTTEPQVKLDVIGTIRAKGVGGELISFGGGEPRLTLNDTEAGGRNWGVLTNNAWANGGLSFYDHTIDMSRMIIDASGNVGIGTTAPGPTIRLAVAGGDFTLNNVALFAARDLDNSLAIHQDGPFKIANGIAGGYTTRMVVNPNGKVGIGTTTPDYKFHVDTGVGGDGDGIYVSGNKDWATFIEIYNSKYRSNPPPYGGHWRIGAGGGGDANAPLGALIFHENTIGTHMVIKSETGNVGIGTTSPTLGPLQMGSGAYVTSGGVWTNASSRAYKQDIAPLGLDKAMKTLTGLQPVTFRYKRAPDEQHVGFISEDVPELVVTKDRTGLSAMDIVAVLTKVVQQQQKELETLKQEVSGLKRAL